MLRGTMAFCNNEYFEKIGHIQENMHDMEKRRLELERDLFSYCRSDQRVAQLKHAKLRRYLKEISVKEEQAKARNRELLKSVDSVASQVDRLWPNRSSLHHMKIECWNRISKLRENQEKQRAILKKKSKDLPPSSAKTLPQHQPSVIFMDRPTIGDPCVDRDTSVLSPWLSHSPPNHHRQPLLPSGLLKDACVSKASAGTDLSDGILDFLQLPDGAAPSERHERRTPGVPSDCGSPVRAAEAPAESSPQVTLRGPKSISPGPAPQRLKRSSLPPSSSHQNSSHDAPVDPISLQRDCGDGPLSSLHKLGENLEIAQGREVESSPAPPSPSLSSSSVDISAESSVKIDSDVSISISDCDLQRSVKTRVSSLRHSEKTKDLPKDKTPPKVPQTTVQDGSDCSSHSSATDRLSLDGLSYLLDHIERCLQSSDKEAYHDLAVSQQQLGDVISLCQGKAALNGEALQACGAVAVQQLQRLSWSTSKGCLLPWELVRANWDCTEQTRIRSCLPADSVPLWDRWLRHALLLRKLDVLTCEEVLQVFTPVLVQPNAPYTDKAEVLLRALFNDAPLDLSSTPSDNEDSSSAGLPSIVGDSDDIQPERPAIQRPSLSLAMHGVQSGEEESADQGSLESIPIRETKAYQLLKQSASQVRHWSSKADKEELEEGEDEDDEEGSSLEPPGSLAKEKNRMDWGKNTTTQNSSFRKEKTKAEALSAIQSKAFWGESDDSNSDIEIALRPQSWKSGDDTDDFYD
ncbi:centrosomal protein kizuna [Alosa alosa]|uniref:centrosomal protein kizuna n=1 Tax=Alosa alosa TaxID=278164 RepID=UPI0020151188|nr:centrosomal protein kizuna [Alosa alosa]